MNKTEISWTDLTWNPVTGCSKVSPGCQNCYAEYLTVHRFHKSFDVMLRPERLKDVRKIPAGSKVFVNSMSDLFHMDVSVEFFGKIMEKIVSRPDVTFQVLTKRPERIFSMLNSTGYLEEVPPNLWLGVSVELPLYKKRIDILKGSVVPFRDIRAPLFVSFEPLLGDIGEVDLESIDWIIIGGESGSKHRPFNPDWARNLIRQAKEQDVAVWMKQMGGFRPGNSMEELPEDLRFREFPEVRA